MGRMRPPSGQHLVGAREIMSNREDPRTRDLRRSPSRRRTPTAGTPTAILKLRLSAAALIPPRSAWKRNAANYHLRGKATYPRGGMSLCQSTFLPSLAHSSAQAFATFSGMGLRSEPPRTRTWNLEIKSLCRRVSARFGMLLIWRI